MGAGNIIKNNILSLKIRNPIVLLAAFICLATLFTPWWSITVSGLPINVYPHYIEMVRKPFGFTGPPAETARMMFFTFSILSASLLMFLSSFIKGILGRLLTGAGCIIIFKIVELFKGAIEDHIEMANRTQMYVAQEAPGEVYIAAEGRFTYLGTVIITEYGPGVDLAFMCGVIGIISILVHDIFVIKFR